MFSLKAVYFYFLAVKILLIRFVKKIYFSTDYYNKSLKTKLPEQLCFYPNPFLLSCFVNHKIFTFKLSKVNIDIEIDGGINFNNSKTVKASGANILVSGSTIFKEHDGNLKKNIQLLRSN